MENRLWLLGTGGGGKGVAWGSTRHVWGTDVCCVFTVSVSASWLRARPVRTRQDATPEVFWVNGIKNLSVSLLPLPVNLQLPQNQKVQSITVVKMHKTT